MSLETGYMVKGKHTLLYSNRKYGTSSAEDLQTLSMKDAG
jgi:hypothetical protein